MNVANTIKTQIGFWSLAEVGARSFVGYADRLQFIAKPRHRLVIVEVTLNARDTYDVRVRRNSIGNDELYAVEGVYFDGLPSIIRGLADRV